MHGRRGHSLPSEKLNHLSECEQSAYERDEIHTTYTRSISVLCSDVFEDLGTGREF